MKEIRTHPESRSLEAPCDRFHVAAGHASRRNRAATSDAPRHVRKLLLTSFCLILAISVAVGCLVLTNSRLNGGIELPASVTSHDDLAKYLWLADDDRLGNRNEVWEGVWAWSEGAGPYLFYPVDHSHVSDRNQIIVVHYNSRGDRCAVTTRSVDGKILARWVKVDAPTNLSGTFWVHLSPGAPVTLKRVE